jgi:DNA-directed RNA polymerase specialized sigma24 family protein
MPPKYYRDTPRYRTQVDPPPVAPPTPDGTRVPKHIAAQELNGPVAGYTESPLNRLAFKFAPDDAPLREDLVAEAQLAIVNGPDEFNTLAFFYTVAKNKMLDVVKHGAVVVRDLKNRTPKPGNRAGKQVLPGKLHWNADPAEIAERNEFRQGLTTDMKKVLAVRRRQVSVANLGWTVEQYHAAARDLDDWAVKTLSAVDEIKNSKKVQF